MYRDTKVPVLFVEVSVQEYRSKSIGVSVTYYVKIIIEPTHKACNTHNSTSSELSHKQISTEMLGVNVSVLILL